MRLWIIENGEKRGPLEDYEVREMIRGGKIERDTRVWHEGAESWVQADEVEVLKGEFVVEQPVPPPIPPDLPPPRFLAWRRFGARWFDFLLYQLLLFVVFKIGGLSLIGDPTVPPSIWEILAQLAPVILMEAALVSAFGFTPGKWLLSLKVTDREGNMLSTGQAIMRTMRVWILGMGMRIDLLLIIGHVIALWFGLKKRAPVWDLATGYRVPGSALKMPRLVIFWILMTVIFTSIAFLIWPEVAPIVEAEMARQGK